MSYLTVEQINAKAREQGLDRISLHYNNLLTQEQYKVCYETTQEIVTPGMKVLDWGCGNGHYSFFLDLLGADITGFSLFDRPSLINGARNFRFVQGAIEEPVKLPFGSNSFDAVFNIGVLQLVHTTGGVDQASLVELFRVTRPGGFFVTVHLPNRHGWTEPLSRFTGTGENFHLFKYTRSQIERMWNSAGFDVVEMRRYGFMPRNQLRKLPAFLLRSRAFSILYNFFDASLMALFPVFCQNWYVIARKPS